MDLLRGSNRNGDREDAGRFMVRKGCLCWGQFGKRPGTWSVRLKALLPNWMPWIRQHYRLSPPMEKQLLRSSARQIDRRLKAKKRERKRRIYGRTKPGSLLKHHIPVRTDSWDVQAPGFSEIDPESHSGNSAEGEFAHSLNLIDIHSDWTESRVLLGKSQVAVQRTLDEIEGVLPFRLLGLDSDILSKNGSTQNYRLE